MGNYQFIRSESLIDNVRRNVDVPPNTDLTFPNFSTNSVYVQDLNSINKFVNGTQSNEISTGNIDILLSIDNNKNSKLTDTILGRIKSYKNDILDEYYTTLENKTNSILSINNNSEIFLNNSFEKIQIFNDIVTKIKDGIEEKTILIKSNSFENVLKDFILNPDQGTKYFNVITNNLIDNINLELNSTNLASESIFQKYSYVKKNSSLHFVNQKFYKDHNLIKLNSDVDQLEFTKEIRSTSNDIVIQNLVTLARSLYTLAPQTLMGNYAGNTEFNYLQLDQNKLKCLKSEINDFDMFSYISTTQSNIDVTSIINTGKFVHPPVLSHSLSRDLDSKNLESSYNETKGIHYLSSQLLDYINDTMISNVRKHYHTSNTSNASFSFNEINKVYTGNFFDVHLTNDNLSDLEWYTDQLDNEGAQNFLLRDNPFYLNNKNYSSNAIIYFNKLSITNISSNISSSSSPAQQLRDSQDKRRGIIKSAGSFLMDSFHFNSINNLEYKLKLDSFVKKQKLAYIKNKNINLNPFNEIIKNIDKSDNNELLLSYCKSDYKNLSVIDNSSAIYDMLFTSNDDIDYSHTDLISSHKIDKQEYRGLDALKEKNISINSNNESLKNNIKLLFANYYMKNSFFCSSYFFNKLIKSVINEANVSDTFRYEDLSTTQALYFSFFKNNEEENIEIKKLVAKRFLKKAIQKDKITNSLLRQSKTLSSFVYDVNNIIKEDYDTTAEDDMNKYLDDILASSDNLKLIRNSIFGLHNIADLQKASMYQRVSNIKIHKKEHVNTFGNWHVPENNIIMGIEVPFGADEGVLVLGNEDIRTLESVWGELGNAPFMSAVIHCNIFPYHNLTYIFKSNSNFSQDSNIMFIREIKNKVEVVNNNIIIKKLDSNFDITKSKNIKVKISSIVKNSFNSKKDSYFILEDMFDSACDSKDFVFNDIINVIQDMLRLNIKDFNKQIFINEEDIDLFIEDNEFLLYAIIELIDLYKNKYLTYFSRIQRIQSLKIFKNVKSYYDPTWDLMYTHPNGLITKHSKTNTVYKFFNSATISSKDSNLDIISDFVELFESSKEIFLDDIDLSSSNENWKTNFTKSLYNIMKSLFISDISQSFTFDIINGYINHQSEMINANRSDVSESNNFKDIDLIDIKGIKDNFYNLFYINQLSKNLLKLSIKNKKNREVLQAITATNDITSDIFVIEKARKVAYINRAGNLCSNSDNLQKEVFFESKNEYLNSNFYSFGIQNKVIKNLSYDSIFKITVSLTDHHNLGRIYMPKVFLFTPLLTDVSFLTNDDLSNYSNIVNETSLIGLYDVNKNIKNRLIVTDTQQLLTSSDAFLKKLLINKLNLSDDDVNETSIFNHMINSHKSSIEITRLLTTAYDILNINEKLNDDIIDNETYELANKLSNKQFFDIFDIDKNKVIENIKTIENTTQLMLPNKFKTIEDNTYYYELLSNLNNFTSFNNIESVTNQKYYDIYNIAVSPKSFYYINADGSSPSNNNALYYNRYNINEFQTSLNKTTGFETNLLHDFGIRSMKSNDIIDNFTIAFSVEVL